MIISTASKDDINLVVVTLKDGKVLEVEKGKTILEVAKQISEGLARMATCGEVNGKVRRSGK